MPRYGIKTRNLIHQLNTPEQSVMIMTGRLCQGKNKC